MKLNKSTKCVLRRITPPPIRKGLRRLFAVWSPPPALTPTYNHDCLVVYGKSVEWLNEKEFKNAYSMGMDSGHKIGREAGSKTDIHIEWRAHICCWAARHAILLAGDFVECGVNTGMMSLTICHLLNFADQDRKFYLFDTYNGIPEEQMSKAEREQRMAENKSFYEDCYETAKSNFSAFTNVQLVRGCVPESLSLVDIEKVSYLHLDMNIALPEIAAAEHFWPKLVPGGIVILDDYGWLNYSEQRIALDSFANRMGVHIATLPTGQGLLLKPN